MSSFGPIGQQPFAPPLPSVAFFRLCLKGGSCSGHGWIVSPGLPSKLLHGERGAAFSTESPAWPSPWACWTRGRTRSHVAPDVFARFTSLPPREGSVPCSARGVVSPRKNSFGSEQLGAVALCRVVLCTCFLVPFLRSKNQSSATPKRNCLVVEESLRQ